MPLTPRQQPGAINPLFAVPPTSKFEPKLRLNLERGQLSARANPTTHSEHSTKGEKEHGLPSSMARYASSPRSSPRGREQDSRPAPWVHNWGVTKVPGLGHNLMWGRGISAPSEERAVAEVMQRNAKTRSPRASPEVLAAANLLHGVISDGLLSGPRATNQPSSARCEPWVLSVLRSISDPAYFDEADDSRLIPALESWLDARSTASYVGMGGRVIDSFDEHGVTILHAAACFGKLELARELLRLGADFNRASGEGRTPIVYACLGPSLPAKKAAILELLLGYGARDGLGYALEVACILGRAGLVRILSAHGAVPPGQIVQFAGHLSGRLGANSLPDYEGAVGKVLQFDHARGRYIVQVLATRRGVSYGRPEPLEPPARYKEIDVVPAGLHVALQHVSTEKCKPILGGTKSPLDIAAAALAGAAPFPKSKRSALGVVEASEAPPPMKIVQSGPQVRIQILKGGSDNASTQDAPGGMSLGVGVLGARPDWTEGELSAGPPRTIKLRQPLDAASACSPSPLASPEVGAASPRGANPNMQAAGVPGVGTSLPEGTAVKVRTSRIELWLRGRVGRIHSFDAPTRCYIVLLSGGTTGGAEQRSTARGVGMAHAPLPPRTAPPPPHRRPQSARATTGTGTGRGRREEQDADQPVALLISPEDLELLGSDLTARTSAAGMTRYVIDPAVIRYSAIPEGGTTTPRHYAGGAPAPSLTAHSYGQSAEPPHTVPALAVRASTTLGDAGNDATSALPPTAVSFARPQSAAVSNTNRASGSASKARPQSARPTSTNVPPPSAGSLTEHAIPESAEPTGLQQPSDPVGTPMGGGSAAVYGSLAQAGGAVGSGRAAATAARHTNQRSMRHGVAFSAAAKKEQHPPPTGHIALLTLAPTRPSRQPNPDEPSKAEDGMSAASSQQDRYEARSGIGGEADERSPRLKSVAPPKRTYIVNIIDKGGEWRG
jgi:hypothetical protein